MKKTICLIIVTMIVVLLSACVKGKTIMLFRDKDEKFADDRMEQVFCAIEDQNKERLKAIFSLEAIGKAKSIESDVEELLTFIQGKLLSWKREDSPLVIDSVEDGNKTKELFTWYFLETDEQGYLVLLVDYPIDTINPENEGLYAIRILRVEDEHKLEGYLEDWAIPGIYIFNP